MAALLKEAKEVNEHKPTEPNEEESLGPIEQFPQGEKISRGESVSSVVDDEPHGQSKAGATLSSLLREAAQKDNKKRPAPMKPMDSLLDVVGGAIESAIAAPGTVLWFYFLSARQKCCPSTFHMNIYVYNKRAMFLFR